MKKKMEIIVKGLGFEVSKNCRPWHSGFKEWKRRWKI